MMPHYENDFETELFYVDPTEKIKRVDQFVGFVSSHTTANTLKCFHLHSFAVFHRHKGKSPYEASKDSSIVTCLLTARDHILTNMQDRVLQMLQ